jgi:hypothetical protein
VALDPVWAELHARRFPELPFDCGKDNDPGIVDGPDLRDWSKRATTTDQLRIERYIDRYDLRDRHLLHIGIGNSGLARRFHRRVKSIVGTSIDDPEIEVARGLDLANYRVVKHNKYSDSDATSIATQRFDFIIDNNLTSPCCCIRHLAGLLQFLDTRLATGGQIVTDRAGLEWIPPGANGRWSFEFDDLAAVANAAGLNAYRIDANVFVLAHEPTDHAAALSLMRHKLRRFAMIPGTLVELSRKAFRRLLRSTSE